MADKHKKDVKEKKGKECKACELSTPMACPFCTKEGLVLIALAIILIAINNQYTRYLAWAALLAAFMVPLIKQLVSRR